MRNPAHLLCRLLLLPLAFVASQATQAQNQPGDPQDHNFVIDHLYYRSQQGDASHWVYYNGEHLPGCLIMGTSESQNPKDPVAKGRDTVNKHYFHGKVVVPAVVTVQSEVNTTSYHGRYAVTTIDDGLFQGQPYITEVVLPDIADAMKHHGFQETDGLNYVTIPQTTSKLQNIGYEAFHKSGIKTITLPTSIETISGNAFGEARNLDCVVFQGDKSVDIEHGAFRDNDNLKSIMVLGAVPTIAGGNDDLKNATCYVPEVTPEIKAAFGDKAKSIIQGITTVYGKDPECQLAINEWAEKPLKVSAKYANGNLPAGCYTNEPINVTLSGPVNAEFTIRRSFFLEPATVTATLGTLGTIYGEDFDLTMIPIEWEGFVGNDNETNAILFDKIDFQLANLDGSPATKNDHGHYNSGTYKVSAASKEKVFATCNGTTLKGGPFTYSECSPQNYKVKFEYGDARLVIDQAENPITGLDGNEWKQGDITLMVDQVKSFVAAKAKTTVSYSLDPTGFAELNADQLSIKGLKVGHCKLFAKAATDPNYKPAKPLSVNVTVTQKNSDIEWLPKDPDPIEVGDCSDIEAATSSDGATIKYTVAEAERVSNPDGSVTFTNEYATILVKADGSLTVCGKHQGSFTIEACTEATDQMKEGCKEIDITIVQPDPKDLPEGVVSWGKDNIVGVVGQKATYDAPRINLSILNNPLTNAPYAGLEATITISNDHYATVNPDWKNKANGTLECLHATNGKTVRLTLKVTDKGDAGADPIYKDFTRSRLVIVNKKDGDDSGFRGGDWPVDGKINVLVGETKALPNPAKAPQDPCKVVYDIKASWIVANKGADCKTSVKAEQAGEAPITVTIPGDEDTNPVSGQLTLIAVRNNYNVEWNAIAADMKVDDTQQIPLASYQLRGQQRTDVPAEYYSFTEETVNFANDGSITASHPGTAAITLTLPDTKEYIGYTKTVTFKVGKKDSDLDWGDTPSDIEIVSGACKLINAPTSSQNITYTVVTASETKILENGDADLQTTYATITVDGDGNITVCGIHVGHFTIKACTEATDDMEGSCKEVDITVNPANVTEIPTGYITWSEFSIEGKVGDKRTFPAPVVTPFNGQNGENYDGIELTMTIVPDDKASFVGGKNGLDGQQGELSLDHATPNGAKLVLRAHDLGQPRNDGSRADVLYKDLVITRNIQINKKPGDDSGFHGDNWPEDGIINVKVLETKELPNPAVAPQDPCGVFYETTSTDNGLAKGSDPNCTWAVTPNKPGETTVNVTIPGNDDTEPVTGQLTIKATRNDRQVVWIETLDNMKVDAEQLVTQATWKPVNADRENVSESLYQFNATPTGAADFADFNIEAKAVGQATLTLQMGQDDTYEAYEKSFLINITKKESDFNWPTEEEQQIMVGGKCLSINAPTASGTVSYTVEEKVDEVTAGNGNKIIVTHYATVEVDPDGNLTICGKSEGTVHITACQAEMDDMEAQCKTIIIDVIKGDPQNLPEGYITWSGDDITAMVAQTVEFDKPIVATESLLNVQTGKPYAGIELTMSLSKPVADIDYDYSQPYGNGIAHLTGTKATAPNSVWLTLRAHDKGDNGAEPIYRDGIWQRKVIISKKKGDDSGFSNWPADGVLVVKVQETKDLPNPAVEPDQDPCEVLYDTDQAVALGLNKDDATCTWTVTPTKPGETTITVTIPGDDNTEDVSKDLTIRAILNERVVDWPAQDGNVVVDQQLTIPGATITPLNEEAQPVDGKFFSIVQTANYAQFIEGQVPSINALNVGEVQVKLNIPADNVYEAYDKSVTITIDKKDVKVTNADGTDPRNPADYYGEVGETITLDALVAPEGYDLTYEVADAWKEYVKINYYGNGLAKATLYKPTDENTPAIGYCYIAADNKTNESERIELRFTIGKKTGDVTWGVKDQEEGVVEQTIVLPLPETTYGDITKFDADHVTITTVDREGNQGAATVTEVVSANDATPEKPAGIYIHLDHVGEVTVTVKIDSSDLNEESTKSVPVVIKGRTADLQWDCPKELNAYVGDEVILPAPHTSDNDKTDDDLITRIRELYSSQVTVDQQGIHFTPMEMGDYHVTVTAPSTNDYTENSQSAVVHVTKKPGNLTWPMEDMEGMETQEIKLILPTTTDDIGRELTYDDIVVLGDNAEIRVNEAGETVLYLKQRGEVTLQVVKPETWQVEEVEKNIIITITGYSAIDVLSQPDSNLYIAAENGQLVIKGATSHVVVYDLAGRTIHQGGNATLRVQPGLYIVVVGKTATKVLVK